MDEWMNKLNELLTGSLPACEQAMAGCERQSPMDDGNISLIGLDDLTCDGQGVFEGPACDERLKYLMATRAVQYAHLIDEMNRGHETVYPAIAMAMGVVGQTCFTRAEDGSVMAYRDAIPRVKEEKR